MDASLKHISVALYKQVLDRGQDLEMKVGGFSMWPFVKDGETLILRKTPCKDISIGDIVAFVLDDRVICHRVFRKNGRYIQTKADALPGLDVRVPHGDILGKAVALKRNGRLHRYDGPVSGLAGRFILWISFPWAAAIPLLRRLKAVFVH